MVLGNTEHAVYTPTGYVQMQLPEGINASARYQKNWVTTGDPAREFAIG